MYYVAFVHADADSIGFTVPDVPGFTADIETTDMDVAITEATKVLTGHLAEMDRAPHARSIADIRADPACAQDLGEASAIVLLPGLRPVGRVMRVNLSLDEGTLSMIDREAKERGITRSALVQAAAYALIGERSEKRERADA